MKTVVVQVIPEIILSYIGIIVSSYKDPYQSIAIMECQPRVSNLAGLLFKFFHPTFRCKSLKMLHGTGIFTYISLTVNLIYGKSFQTSKP